jgi:hypothetical protein
MTAYERKNKAGKHLGRSAPDFPCAADQDDCCRLRHIAFACVRGSRSGDGSPTSNRVPLKYAKEEI